MNKFYITCSCSSPDHEVIIMIDNDSGELYMYTQLHYQSFLKRLVIGLKYIFGARASNGTGHWEETLLMQDQVVDLAQKLLTNINLNSISNAGRRKLILGVKELREKGLPHEEDMKKNNG